MKPVEQMRRVDLKGQVACSIFCAFAEEGLGLFARAFEMAAHVHLTARQRKILFDDASAETVEVRGPKGALLQVPILPGEAVRSQVVLSFSEALQIGIKGPALLSDKRQSSGDCVLWGPAGKVSLDGGVRAFARHLHLSPAQALVYGLSDDQRVWAVIRSENRSLTFGNIAVRVGQEHSLELHLDANEARAAGLTDGQCVQILPRLPDSLSPRKEERYDK